ncbi:uracil-xanthine permease family protein (plasmid) [Streptomyces sp. BI20]|uniref:uracil-xanthine permease family protein n=1 Tax=Streptomyces sp. BI20 TaxID=3403460 RepID=UPI003C728AB4
MPSRAQAAPAAAATPHPVDERLPVRRLVPAALQHVAGMYAGLTAPPLIIGGALGLSAVQLSTLLAAALLVSGLATVAQTLDLFGIGARAPLTGGVSFAVVSPVLAAAPTEGPGTLPAVFGATVVAGVLCLLLAPLFSRLVRFFPPLVNGCVVTLVGLSLLPVAGQWVQGGDADTPGHGSSTNLALAGVTLAVTLLLHRALSGRFLGRVATLLGMIVGTLVAVPLGKVDTSTFQEAPAFALPTPFAFGTPTLVPAVIGTTIVVMLVSMTESTAALIGLGAVTDRPATPRSIAGGLRAQGLATALGGVLGGFVTTSYAQNVGLVALSRIHSRYVVTVCGAVLALMGLVPVLGSLVAVVPLPVLGGAGIVFFGSVAVAGIRTLAKAALGTGHNAIIASVTFAVGLFPIADPGFYAALPGPLATVLGSGITAGCLVALVLNHLLNNLGGGSAADPAALPALDDVAPAPATHRAAHARPVPEPAWSPFGDRPTADPAAPPAPGAWPPYVQNP